MTFKVDRSQAEVKSFAGPGEYTVVVNDVAYGNAEFPDEYVFVARWKQWVTE